MDKQSRKKIIDSYKARRSVGGVFAVRNAVNGKRLVQPTADMQGSRNRFEFSQTTGGCAFMPLQEDFKKYGAGAFSFEIIEELEQKEGQDYSSFRKDIDELYGMLIQDIDPEELY